MMPANARIISKTLTFLLPHLYPLLCGVDVSYETPSFSKKTLNVVLNLREMFMVYMSTVTLTLIVARVLASVQ